MNHAIQHSFLYVLTKESRFIKIKVIIVNIIYERSSFHVLSLHRTRLIYDVLAIHSILKSVIHEIEIIKK
jgi:hypothetical protein